jgi:uncharacterized protein YjbI with pentapeptide repeats
MLGIAGRRVGAVVGVLGLVGGILTGMGFSAAAASNLGASIKKHSCVPGPRADLVRCNFVGADLAGADLAGARLNRAKLRDANLTGANLTDTKLDHAVLIRADLSAVTSGGITGTPASLPTNWILVDGYLIGPGADLAGANLSHANLLGATGSRITSRSSGSPSAVAQSDNRRSSR